MRNASIAAFMLSALAVSPVDAGTWLTYQNDRYGTTIDYPDIFKPQPAPDDHDGLTFKTADGAKISVFASYNALDFDLAAYKNFTLKDLGAGKIVYQAQGANWFVISGSDPTGVFYERHMLSHKSEMTEGLVISYPVKLRAKYDPLVARISKSFRSGEGFQTQ